MTLTAHPELLFDALRQRLAEIPQAASKEERVFRTMSIYCVQIALEHGVTPQMIQHPLLGEHLALEIRHGYFLYLEV